MLGEILGEFVSAALGDLTAPSTDRARVRLNLLIGLVAAGAQVLAFGSYGDPLRGPQWAFGLMMLGMLLGIFTFVLSLACLIRIDGHRMASGISVALGGAALFWPLSLLVR